MERRTPSPGKAMSLDDLAKVRGLLTHAPLRMGLIVVAVALCFAAWNLSSAPVYRSSVKVRVDDVTAKRRQVEHRSIPTGTIDEGEALTTLRSRSLLRQIVLPAQGSVAAGDPSVGLGLTTWVTDESAPPLRRLIRRSLGPVSENFRLQATATRRSDTAPDAVQVTFVDAHNVSICGADWPTSRSALVTFQPGETLSYYGMELDLKITGHPDGRTWRIESLTPDVAIDRVLRGLRVDKQQHQTGTLALTVLDDDAERAAAIADAIAKAFVLGDLESAQADARETARFLEHELELRRTVLDALTAKEALLQQANPDTLHPDATALGLSDREGNWDDAYRKARNRRLLADRVAAMLASGQPLRTALAAVGGNHSPEVHALLAALDTEEAQLRQVFRGSGDGGYRRTLLLKADDYRIEAERFRTRVADLTDIIGRIDTGDWTALSRLGGDLARDGSVAVDWNMRLWMTELESTRGALEKLQAEFTDAYPPVVQAQERMDYFSAQILGGLRALLQGYEGTLAQKTEYAESWFAIHAAYPEGEAGLIRASIAQLEKEAVAAFSGHAASLRVTETAAYGEVQRLRDRQKQLVASKQALRSTQLETRELDRIVGELVRDSENARVALAGITPSARVVDTAIVPAAPLKPNAAFGLLAGLVLGVLTAAAWAWFDLQREPRGAVQTNLVDGHVGGVPIIGRVAVTGPTSGTPRQVRLMREPAGPKPLWLPMLKAPDSAAAQGYRLLRARLKGHETATVLGVTSARGGEGSATAAINLAMAHAQLGERVLVIDGHAARPTLQATLQSAGLRAEEVFGLDADPSLGLGMGARTAGSTCGRGFTECLDGTAHWSELTHATGFPTMQVLCAGRSAVAPADLLGGPMLSTFCASVRTEFDVVLIGLPPVGEGPEAEAAASTLDGLLYIESEVDPTPAAIVTGCLQRLAQAGGQVLGVIKTVAVERRRGIAAGANEGPFGRSRHDAA